MAAGSIDAPEDTDMSQTASADEDDAGLTRSVRKGYRAPLVTGSFNHPVLPMPPVSHPSLHVDCLIKHQWFMRTTAQDDDTSR